MRGRGEGTYYRSGELFCWKLRHDGRTVVRKAATLSELRKKVKKALDELERRGEVAPAGSDPTLGSYLASWLETWVKPNRAGTTYRHYDQTVRLYVSEEAKKTRLSKLTPSHCQRIINRLREEGLSPQTAILTRNVLHRALGLAVRHGMILSNPVDGTERPQKTFKQGRSLSRSEAAALRAALSESDSIYAPLLLLILSSGLRISEALGLSVSDASGEVIQVRRKLEWSGGEYRLTRVKTGRSMRAIPVGPRSAEAIEMQTRYRESIMGSLGRWAPKHDLLFVRMTGEPMIARNVQRSLDAHLSALGLPHVSLHDLRRTVSSTLASSGVRPHVLQAIMGHEDVRTTFQIYALAEADDLKAAASLLE